MGNVGVGSKKSAKTGEKVNTKRPIGRREKRKEFIGNKVSKILNITEAIEYRRTLKPREIDCRCYNNNNSVRLL